MGSPGHSLPPSCRLVYNFLLRGPASPSTISTALSMPPRTVRWAIHRLESLNLAYRHPQRRQEDGRFTSSQVTAGGNLYIIANTQVATGGNLDITEKAQLATGGNGKALGDPPLRVKYLRERAFGGDAMKDREDTSLTGGAEQATLFDAPKNQDWVRPADVVELWNEILGDVHRVRILTDDRARKIRARMKSIPELRTLEGWRRYFELISSSRFLRGHNKRGWSASLDWAVRSDNVVAKVYEMRYHDKRVTTLDEWRRVFES